MSSLLAPISSGASLSPSQGLDYGQDYTFSFKLSAWLATVSIGDIQAALTQLQDLGSVNVTESASGSIGLDLAGGIWDVSFTFQGDDTVATVTDVAKEISTAVSSTHYLVSFDFQAAFTGDTGIVGSGAADAGLNKVADATGDFTTTLIIIGVAIVAIIILLKFI